MKKEFAIEHGFQIVVLFLMGFWEKFLKEKMLCEGLIIKEGLNPKELKQASVEKQNQNAILSGNEFVFCTVCGDPAGPGDYFEKIVEKRMNLSPSEQRSGLVLEERTLFQLAIDFCAYFNEQFESQGKSYKRKGSLNFAMNWLKDMRDKPSEHKEEWKIWDDTITYVLSPGEKHLIF